MANEMLYPKNTRCREVIDLSGMWKFCFGKKEDSYYIAGLKEYEYIPVPAAYNDFFTEKGKRDFCGDVYYEHNFYVSDIYKDKDIDIRFFASSHKTTVYLNNKEIMYHNGGFTPFSININDYIKFNEENTLVVKVNNELDQTTLPVGEVKVLIDGTKVNKPYFDFFHYAGLIRPVKLVITPKKSILDITLNHEIIGSDTITYYDVLTNCNLDVLLQVYDATGNLIKTQLNNNEVKIKDTKLWKVNEGYLYNFVFKLMDKDKVVDEYKLKVGIRTVKVVGNRLLLNNESIYLKGFGKHEDSSIIGRGLNLAVIKRDFELMKWINANSFRTSHYPYSEEVYQLADEEGILVIDELATVGMFKSLMNFLEATTKESTAYFEQEIVKTQTLKNHLEALEKLIKRDKNYACVIMWSLLNEPDTSSDESVKYFEEVFNKCQILDVQKRPRTFAHIMFSTPDKSKCSHLCDVIALNRYYGWYLNGGNEISDSIVYLDKELDAWDTFNKPVFFAEYGADTINGVSKLPSVMWSVEYQIEYLKENHKIFDKHKCIMGEQVWNFADFQTVEGIMRADGNKKGIFTKDRQPKPSAYYLKDRWHSLKDNYKA